MNKEQLRMKDFNAYMQQVHDLMQQQIEDTNPERLNNSLYHELLELNNNDM